VDAELVASGNLDVRTLEVAGAVGLLLVSALIAWGRRSRTKALAGWLQR
jgi:hypothetical protein